MRIGDDDLLVTPSEAVALLRTLERRAVRAVETDIAKLTAARLRYLEHYGIVPTVPGSGLKGLAGTRLYNPIDIALLRLWLRLSADVGPMAARFTLTYVGRSVRTALARRRREAVVIHGKRAAVVPVRDAAIAPGVIAVIPVLSLLDGVAEAIRQVREDRPELWAGRAWLTPAEAMEELAAV